MSYVHRMLPVNRSFHHTLRACTIRYRPQRPVRMPLRPGMRRRRFRRRGRSFVAGPDPESWMTRRGSWFFWKDPISDPNQTFVQLWSFFVVLLVALLQHGWVADRCPRVRFAPRRPQKNADRAPKAEDWLNSLAKNLHHFISFLHLRSDLISSSDLIFFSHISSRSKTPSTRRPLLSTAPNRQQRTRPVVQRFRVS